MGAYSPTPIATDTLQQKIMEQIIKPTIQAMESEGRKYYRDFYTAGLMIDKEWEYKSSCKYNCRLGDNRNTTNTYEIDRDSNIADACLLSTQGKLSEAKMEWDKRVFFSALLWHQTDIQMQYNYRRQDPFYPTKHPTQNYVHADFTRL